jgi:hypothetical protein
LSEGECQAPLELASRHLTSLVLCRWSSLRRPVWSTAWSCKVIAFRVSRTGTRRRRRRNSKRLGKLINI